MAYFGWIRCDTCTIQYITEPSAVTVWITPGEMPRADITCPSCKEIVSDNINRSSFLVFKKNNCQIKSINDKFEPLTEDLINSSDIIKELENFAN